jgi:transcriptional regulator with XRE-family HTH domain
MATKERGKRFNELVGDEMKKAFKEQGFSAREVERILGIDHSTFANYLNGKRDIPVPITVRSCEVIGVEPEQLAKRAYLRLVAEMGDP